MKWYLLVLVLRCVGPEPDLPPECGYYEDHRYLMPSERDCYALVERDRTVRDCWASAPK